jgi:hypothetical protein
MMTEPKPQYEPRSLILRATQFLLLFMAFLSGVNVSALEEGEVPTEVQDLRYGVVLYHFYQQSYFEALTESLVGEQRQDMPYHAQSAKLLRGGMSLSYGMGDEAAQIFSELLDNLGKDEEKNRAWYYLGKLHYIRNDKDAAAAAFAHIDQEELDPDLVDEFIYLSARLLLRADQQEAADEKIAELDERSPWIAYYHFNRGAKQTVAGNWEQGVETFALVENSELEDNEGRILQDRAHIASGFAYLGAGEYDQAIDDFTSVRLESPLVERAMLGFGWAEAQQNHFEKALSPWQALSKRSVLNSSVQESLLAIPFAYEKLEAPASALTQYLSAADVYAKELLTIREAIASYRDAPMSEILSESTMLASDWITAQEYLPINKEAPYLAHLIAQDHFQSAISDHSDLRRMADYLEKSIQRFAALNGVLSLQKQVWQESLDNALREKYRERYEGLLSIKQQLQDKLTQAEQEGDGRRLVDPEEQVLWIRAEQAAQRIKTLKAADYDVSEEEETLRLYRGLLAWRADEDFPVKQWEFKNQFSDVSELAEETRIKLEKIETLSVDRFDSAFAQRMSVMERRINQQSQDVNRALAQSEERIRQLAVEELLQQDKRISFYLGQAKLAIARLYDAGSSINAGGEE